jgi:hypothetical protein
MIWNLNCDRFAITKFASTAQYGFHTNRVKVRVAIDTEYDVPNRIKMNVFAGVFSPMVVPKVLGLLNELPEGCAATKEDGNIIILLDKMHQLTKFYKHKTAILQNTKSM